MKEINNLVNTGKLNAFDKLTAQQVVNDLLDALKNPGQEPC